MPISAAAMEGIQANGHRWRKSIRFGFAPRNLGRLNDIAADGGEVADAAVEKEALRIVAATRSFVKAHPDFESLDRRADELEALADCGLDEVNCAMSELYDDLDWRRILVVAPRFPLPASCDTHPKDGDATKIVAPLVSGAVGEAGTPNLSPSPHKEGDSR